MSYEFITEYAGWFLAVSCDWNHHFYGDHFITGYNNLVTPHYKLDGALSGFAGAFRSARLTSKEASYQEILDSRGIAITADRLALSNVDATFLDAESVLAIIDKCVSEDPDCKHLLYEAAASSLLDRCLFKLADIDRMSYPKRERERDSSYVELVDDDYFEEKRDGEYPQWVWCLVGNVVNEHAHGSERTVVHGTKHFSPGTKVYCYPGQWGDGYNQIVVLGKHRGSRGLVRMIMKRDLIENFRCKKVFSPSVIKRMYAPTKDGVHFVPWGSSRADHAQILSMLEWLNSTSEESARRSVLAAATQIVFAFHRDDAPEGDVSLRIEKRSRRDGCYGGGWYGYYTRGRSPEQPIGLLDWFGYWPDDAPYEECDSKYRDERRLITGLIEAGVHVWDASYEADSNTGVVPYAWSLEITADEGRIGSCGKNACPPTLPSVLRYLEAWGFRGARDVMPIR